MERQPECSHYITSELAQTGCQKVLTPSRRPIFLHKDERKKLLREQRSLVQDSGVGPGLVRDAGWATGRDILTSAAALLVFRTQHKCSFGLNKKSVKDIVI